MTSVVDVNATLRQSMFDTRSLRRSQSEESAERLQRDRTVSVDHHRIEIERVELGHEETDLVLAASAQAVLGEALLREKIQDGGGSIVTGRIVCGASEARGTVAV